MQTLGVQTAAVFQASYLPAMALGASCKRPKPVSGAVTVTIDKTQ